MYILVYTVYLVYISAEISDHISVYCLVSFVIERPLLSDSAEDWALYTELYTNTFTQVLPSLSYDSKKYILRFCFLFIKLIIYWWAIIWPTRGRKESVGFLVNKLKTYISQYITPFYKNNFVKFLFILPYTYLVWTESWLLRLSWNSHNQNYYYFNYYSPFSHFGMVVLM